MIGRIHDAIAGSIQFVEEAYQVATST